MGNRGRRSIDDEQYIQMLLGVRNETATLSCIVDVRTKLAAANDKMKGGKHHFFRSFSL
jgi:hypothetical protein